MCENAQMVRRYCGLLWLSFVEIRASTLPYYEPRLSEDRLNSRKGGQHRGPCQVTSPTQCSCLCIILYSRLSRFGNFGHWLCLEIDLEPFTLVICQHDGNNDLARTALPVR